MPFAFGEERLRREARGRAIVVVDIADIVRVELDLAVVEVEVRSVREVAITVRISVFVCPWHRNLINDPCWQLGIFLLLNLI